MTKNMAKEELIVKTTPLPQSRISFELEIPSETCKTCVNETISSISRSAKIPGFRLGKIPKQVLIQRIGITQLHASALEKIIDKSWQEALKIKSIEPLSEPELVDGFESLLEKFSPEKSLKVTLQTDVAPELKLKKSKGLSVEISKNKFDSKSVDEALEKSRSQFANIIPVTNRAAKLGDIAVVSFKGKYKDSGKEIDGGTSESMDLELEKNKMIPGFVEGIVKMKIGDSKTLNLKFPEDYSHEESRGKEAIFEVNLKDLKEKELPELNDDFAKQSGNKESLKELKKDIEKQLKENFEKTQKDIKIEASYEGFLDQLSFEDENKRIQLRSTPSYNRSQIIGLIGGNSANLINRAFISQLNNADAFSERFQLSLYPALIENNDSLNNIFSNENLDIENDGQSTSNEEFSSQAWVAELGLDITDAINFAFQTVPGRDDLSPTGILTFQANPNLELLGSYDANGDWKSQVQLFFRY